jgi:hypothetical protein
VRGGLLLSVKSGGGFRLTPTLLSPPPVGKAQVLKGKAIVSPLFLVAIKTVVLPIITRFVFVAIVPAAPAEAVRLSNFAFLYGSIPTAPGALVYAGM